MNGDVNKETGPDDEKGDNALEGGTRWESAHVCPNCGHILNLAEIDMRAITTGIVSCPKCDWSGKIEIKIVGESATGGE